MGSVRCPRGRSDLNNPKALQCTTPAGAFCWGDSLPVAWRGGQRTGTVDVCVYCEVAPETRPIVVAAVSGVSNTGASEVELPGRLPLCIPEEQRRGSCPCWLSIRAGTETAESGRFSLAERRNFNLEVSPIKIYESSREAVVWWNTSRLPFIPAISVKLYDAETSLLVVKCSQANTGSAVLKLPHFAPLNGSYRVTVTSLKLAHALKDQFHGANDCVVVTDEPAPARPPSGWKDNYITRPSDIVGLKRVYGRANVQIVKRPPAKEKDRRYKHNSQERYTDEEQGLLERAPRQSEAVYNIDHSELARLIVAAQADSGRNNVVASEELMAKINQLVLDSREGKGRRNGRKDGSRSPGSPTGVFDFDQASPRASSASHSSDPPSDRQPPGRGGAAKPAAPANSKQAVAGEKSNQPAPRRNPAKSKAPPPARKPSQPKGRTTSTQTVAHVQPFKEEGMRPDARPQEGNVKGRSYPVTPACALLGPSCLPPIMSATHWKAKRVTPSLKTRLRTAVEAGNVVDFSEYGVKYGEMCPNAIDLDHPMAILL